MKLSELRKIIQEVINEGDTYAGKDAVDDFKKDPKYNTLSQTAKTDAESKLNQGQTVTIGEMANVSTLYQINPEVTPDQLAQFGGKKGKIIQAIQGMEGPVSKVAVAAEMGYPKQNPINSDFMELVRDGVITLSSEQTTRRNPVAPPPAQRTTNIPGANSDEEPGYDEDAARAATDAELSDLGIVDTGDGDMSDDQIDSSFAAAKNSGEKEPQVSPDRMQASDADSNASTIPEEEIEAFYKYMDYKERLAKVKSNILQAKRRGTSVGDIKDKPSNELTNLRTLKTKLDQKIEDLVAASPYLQSRIANEKEKETSAINESKKKLQRLAGIIKG
jgi:hypothetical protein